MNVANPRGPQQEGSRADRRGVTKDAKKAVQQREPDLHHHRTLRETTTRTQNRLGTKTLVPPIVTRTQ